MTIDKKEFEFEKDRLNSTKKWIDNEINIINKNDLDLQNKISELRKQAKGRYNEELETTQKLYNITHKNLEKYTEAKDQPYFARIDFREKYRDNESYYIGKFGLGDSKTGDEIVIDWRSPIADLYYSGTQGETSYEIPDGFVDGTLNLKRKFLIRDSKLKDAFDEGINEIILKSKGEDNVLVDEFLKINLEESVSSKLKDVVATIQKEQNDIIRASKNSPLIVQGSAGSGKTTIALHRLAYLLYKYSKTISGNNILVIAPNKLFLDYISMVLPSLGIDKVRQKTFEEQAVEILQLKGKILTKDKKLTGLLEEEDKNNKLMLESSSLKGSILYKSIMDDYISYIETKDSEIEDIKVDKYVLFYSEDIKRLFIKDMKHLPIDKRKDEIKRYFMIKFNDRILEIMEKVVFKYEYNIARIKKLMEDGPERRKKIIELYDERDTSKKYILKSAKHNIEEYFENWKHKDTKELIYKLFNDENIFDNVVKNNISKELSQYIKDELNHSLEKGIVDSDDLSSMIYLKFRIEGVEEKFRFKHIVIDEAQDYSPFQYYIIKDMAKNNSYTIVGDIGQGIYYYKGVNDWEKFIKEVFNNEGNYVQLTQSYRSTVEIIDFANKVLIKQKNSLKPAKPVLRHGAKPEIKEFQNNKDFACNLDEIVNHCEKIGKSNVAVIGKTYEECKKIKGFLKKYSNYNWNIIKDTDKNVNLEKIIIPSYMTKGLEFDCSVIYNCDEGNYNDSEFDKKILYVVLTRALHLEYIFYNKKLSSLLSDV
ncbi:helicase IV [Clostridium pasteurianum DSM 525 = ATCC 6013]|uniref:Helicase IV n=1 Tax=Clostridium pasteurianum DSM 525 = ATCC 6013 TaxID=1262449 RepID=A0A0H3J693_CLOPA|nr:RNA polymerase recycling motor HelD [Clostridium pasteurianum]AJA48697.1 helicase IV [Clostridium pasteurianum DSM 525 = ATCC 6013]AJA52685.1 helicase IV [Clostridium pasteurianum DSM 525 = ATCC 6013]AOZ75923.1 AAA family ATPase [Clostridium pasteurianum DSM 525 = ATCC 6013]AOZ79719.1 AAA family ATPase [Clostridium pasteurianum]ELP59996.1 Superfamily I DNA helicase [Clostridium pasteurianum DSM 525 = ATCC 6013]